MWQKGCHMMRKSEGEEERRRQNGNISSVDAEIGVSVEVAQT